MDVPHSTSRVLGSLDTVLIGVLYITLTCPTAVVGVAAVGVDSRTGDDGYRDACTVPGSRP